MLSICMTAWSEPQNPPPVNVLAGYDQYELAPLAMGPPYVGDEGKEKARAKIQGFMTAETGAIVMHPGPINRGVEIAPDVADSLSSVILDQVANGVAVRMGILYLMSGAG